MTSSNTLKKWITQTLSADVDFKALCIAQIGEPLNFYRGTPMNELVEITPFFTVFTDEENADYVSRGDFPNTWSVPCALAVSELINSIILDGETTVYTGTDIVEELAIAAIQVLKREIRACNLGDMRILQSRVVVSQIGEADDIQANIFLTFGEMTNI